MSIAAMSEQTAIAKEVLQKWETGYGFTLPEGGQRGPPVAG